MTNFLPWNILFCLVRNFYHCCFHSERFAREMLKQNTYHFVMCPDKRFWAVRQWHPALPCTGTALQHSSCSQRYHLHNHWFHCINLLLQSADDKSLQVEVETLEIRENGGIFFRSIDSLMQAVKRDTGHTYSKLSEGCHGTIFSALLLGKHHANNQQTVLSFTPIFEDLFCLLCRKALQRFLQSPCAVFLQQYKGQLFQTQDGTGAWVKGPGWRLEMHSLQEKERSKFLITLII